MRKSPEPRVPRDEVSSDGSAFWRGPGARDPHILGNLIYIGRGLLSVASREPEPALIDTALLADTRVQDCRGRWDWQPSYTHCPPEARAAYLLWLRGGRCDPQSPIGNVLLYFYGLERRAVHDARTDPVARAEIPVIRAELERLLGIYGGHARFQERARALVGFLTPISSRLYLLPPADRAPGDTAMGFWDQVVLGQAAQDAAPLPAAWAYRWALPQLRRLPVPAKQPEALAGFFEQIYRRRHGDGLVLQPGPARVQREYRTVGPSFDGTVGVISVPTAVPSMTDSGELPAGLRMVVREIGEHLAQSKGEVPALPPAVPEAPRNDPQWPAAARDLVARLREDLRRKDLLSVELSDFEAVLPVFQGGVFTFDKYQWLCEELSRQGLGVVPDPRFQEDCSVLGELRILLTDPGAECSAQYESARLPLELTCSVAAAAPGVRDEHVAVMVGWVRAQTGLTPAEQVRLRGYLQVMLRNPPRPSDLKYKIETVSAAGCAKAAAAVVAMLFQGTPSLRVPVQRALYKCLQMLGLDPHVFLAEQVTSPAGRRALASMVPVPAAPARRGYRIPPPPASLAAPVAAPAGPVELDPHKVAALQEEQARLSALLDPVFSEADLPPQVQAAPKLAASKKKAPERSMLLGLDPVASAFLRRLLARPRWTRADLAGLAREHALPLDGVLERINEACFEHLDMPLFEEADPLVLLPETVTALAGR